MQNCPFCRIVDGEQDAHVLHETERTLAFFDRNPAARGHTLVVPKAHHTSLFPAGASLAEAVFRTVRTVSRALTRSLDADGVSLFYTTGDLVGRVDHAHVHLVPRDEADDLTLALPRDTLDDDEAAALAGRVRDAI